MEFNSATDLDRRAPDTIAGILTLRFGHSDDKPLRYAAVLDSFRIRLLNVDSLRDDLMSAANEETGLFLFWLPHN